MAQLLPFEHSATPDVCADCNECGRCAKHDPRGRCDRHGDYCNDKGGCPTCIAEAHHYDCCDKECGGAWVCPGCERLVGYCMGCADELPDHCDDCWHDVQKAKGLCHAEDAR